MSGSSLPPSQSGASVSGSSLREDVLKLRERIEQREIELKQAQIALRRQAEFETLLVELTSQLAEAREDGFDQAIHHAFSELCKFYGLLRIAILHCTADSAVELFHESPGLRDHRFSGACEIGRSTASGRCIANSSVTPGRWSSPSENSIPAPLTATRADL